MTRGVGIALLLLVTLIWGTTFVVVKEALDTIPVSLLLALRFTLAGAMLAWARWERKAVVPALVLGVLSFAGFGSQTIGLSITSASNAAFIEAWPLPSTPTISISGQ